MEENFICKTSLCTGCSACFNKCPHRAITMQPDFEGFLVPVIDKEKCTNCGLCENVCPINNPKISDNLTQDNCYACKTLDENLRENSSSGGMFSEIAKIIFAENGYVCGVKFDENQVARHVIVDNFEDMKALRGSKYVQSEIGDIYQQIETLLEKENYVLFTGTPCQVAGLKSYLSKDYEKLVTVDLICAGVPSPLAFEKFLEEISNGEQIEKINFRDKKYGSKALLTSIEFKNRRRIEILYNNNSYLKAFLSHISTRESCSKCKFATIQRTGDITIGDFWGIEKYCNSLNDDKGISLVLVNNNKGKEIFDKLFINKRIEPIETALKSNHVLAVPFKKDTRSKRFFKALETETFSKALEIAEKDLSKNIAIINFWYSINFGAILTAYALQEILKGMGYNAKLIQNIQPSNKSRYKSSFAQRFATIYLDTTNDINSLVELIKLNNQFDTFVVGSDQVFRLKILGSFANISNYFLAWVNNNKKKIAIAASFGQDTLEEIDNIKTIKKFCKESLNLFDNISIREDSGVELCKKEFGVDATLILDPVFLADKLIFENLSKDGKIELPTKYISSYILDRTQHKQFILNKIIKANQLDCINIDDTFEVVDFVKTLANTDFVITDSFHGLCFAIIFHKQFLCIVNSERGGTRFKTIFKILDLPQENLIETTDIPYENIKIKQIDYDKVDSLLSGYRKQGLEYIKGCLDTPTKTKNTKNLLKIINRELFKRKRIAMKYKFLGIFSRGERRAKYFQNKGSQTEIIDTLNLIKTQLL